MIGRTPYLSVSSLRDISPVVWQPTCISNRFQVICRPLVECYCFASSNTISILPVVRYKSNSVNCHNGGYRRQHKAQFTRVKSAVTTTALLYRLRTIQRRLNFGPDAFEATIIRHNVTLQPLCVFGFIDSNNTTFSLDLTYHTCRCPRRHQPEMFYSGMDLDPTTRILQMPMLWRSHRV